MSRSYDFYIQQLEEPLLTVQHAGLHIPDPSPYIDRGYTEEEWRDYCAKHVQETEEESERRQEEWLKKHNL